MPIQPLSRIPGWPSRRRNVLIFGNVSQPPYCNNLLQVVAAFRSLARVVVVEPRRLDGFAGTGGARPVAVPVSAAGKLPAGFQPDVLVCLAGGLYLGPELRGRLPAGAVSVGLALSDPLGLEASLAIAASFDLFYTQDPHAIPIYADRGLDVAECLPAVDPRMYRPTAGGTPCDILYVGKWTPHRDLLVSALAGRFDVRVHTDAGEKRFSVPVEPPLDTPEAIARAYSAARLALEVSLVEQPGNPLDRSCRLTNRPQFAAACGTPSLIDVFDELPRFFEPGTEAAVYRDETDLLAVAGRLLGDNAERRRMGEQARRRVRRSHSWRRRARRILADVAAFRRTRQAGSTDLL